MHHIPLRTTAAAIGLASVLVLTGCAAGPAGPEIDAPATTLRVNWGDPPANWSPGSGAQSGYLRVPYENLVKLDENYQVVPYLATEWVQEPMALTLSLRDDVTFHDGTPFNAEAVKANLEFVRDTPGQYSGPLQAVASVDIVDEFTAKVNFKFPSPTFLSMLTQLNVPIASPAAIADGSILEAPVGTGPWAFDAEASQDGTKWVFNRTDDYWGELPAYETIELYAIQDDASASAALVNGEIDFTDTTNPEIPFLEENDFIDITSYRAGRNNIVFFDRGPGGVFADVEVRKAVCTAIDMPGILVTDTDIAETPTQHFLEGEPGYNADIVGYIDGDVEAAQAILGDKTLDTQAPSTAFIANEITYYVDQATKVDGIEIEIQELPVPDYVQKWALGGYSMGIGSNNQITPYDWYSTWFAENGFRNPAKSESPELKAAAQAAIAASGTPEADALWGEVMRIIIDEEALACAFGVFGQSLAWNSERVSNVQTAPEPYEVNLVDYRSLVPAGQ